HSPDGSAYHLTTVAEYFRRHGFVHILTDVLANLPQGLELLFLFAFSFGRHSAAALVHFTFLAALPWLMFCYGRRFGISVAGAASAIFVFASPIVGVDGSSAYVDVALAAVLFALFYFLQIWIASPQPRLLVPVGILAGFSFAIKPTAFVACPYALGVVAWTLWRARKPVLRPALTMAVVASLLVLPWLIKSWLWIGNPLTPFANRLFPNPHVHVAFEDELRRSMSGYGWIAYSQLPLELTLSGNLVQGLLGPLFLLAPLSLVAFRTRHGRHLLLAAVVFGASYFSNIGTRFLIPALPFISLALGLSLIRWPALLGILALSHALASWPGVLNRYCAPSAWRLREPIPIRAALRIEPEDSYLRRTLPDYATDRMLEENVPANAQVFSMTELTTAYTSRRILVRYLSAPSEVLGDVLFTALDRNFQPSRILTFSFPELAATRLRVVQNAPKKRSLWSISELKIYDAGREVPPASSWRLTAQPNPWDIQSAFDGNPVTRWRSWLAAEPGMYVEIDFGRSQNFSAVVIETNPEPANTDIRLQTMDAGGSWSFLADPPLLEIRPLHRSLRAAAMLELKKHGIRYLLTRPGDLGALEFQQHPQAWGLRLLANTASARLYFIQ
ncbi:MAG: glycosyltransferase family 39 protein, partial [Acidobacteriota bacterium]|nr:glycosyltransferase family 39 protein [Acidobacteriota bacterium]